MGNADSLTQDVRHRVEWEGGVQEWPRTVRLNAGEIERALVTMLLEKRGVELFSATRMVQSVGENDPVMVTRRELSPFAFGWCAMVSRART